MKATVLLAVILSFVTTGLGSDLALAKTIPAKSPKDVKASCKESGGVSFPKTGPNSTYGCINKDGSGIVCGGVSPKDKKTCDTFRTVPPRLPTRPEVEYAESAEMENTGPAQQK
jgi:hypothetical protein